MYNTVYIYDANEDSYFSSLIMNELAKLGIKFNNIETTSDIYYKNILIWIPKFSFSDKIEGFDEMYSELHKVTKLLYKFKHKLIVVSPSDFQIIRGYVSTLNSNRGTLMYQTRDFDTLCSTIIVNDCIKKLRRLNKFYNKTLAVI